MEIGEDRDILMEQPKALICMFNEEVGNHRKGPKPSKYYIKTRNSQNQKINQQTIKVAYTRIVSKETQENHKVLNHS